MSCRTFFKLFSDVLQEAGRRSRWPERIVDDLEAVEVEEQHGESVGRSPRSGRLRCRRLTSSRVARNTRRLGRPVSGSSDASRATCASASQRFVMSVNV